MTRFLKKAVRFVLYECLNVGTFLAKDRANKSLGVKKPRHSDCRRSVVFTVFRSRKA